MVLCSKTRKKINHYRLAITKQMIWRRESQAHSMKLRSGMDTLHPWKDTEHSCDP